MLAGTAGMGWGDGRALVQGLGGKPGITVASQDWPVLGAEAIKKGDYFADMRTETQDGFNLPPASNWQS